MALVMPILFVSDNRLEVCVRHILRFGVQRTTESAVYVWAESYLMFQNVQ